MLYSQTHAIPTTTNPTIKVGFDLTNASTKMKFYFNVHNYFIEDQFTYLVKPNMVFGADVICDTKAGKLTKYDFAINKEIAQGSNVGIKHESTSKDQLKLGKFLFYFHHSASAFHTVGTEFGFDYQTRATEAKLGFVHKFDDKVSTKFKLNHVGHLDALLKMKLSDTTTANITTGFNIRSFSEQKARALPLGVSFDIKF